jgi:chromosome segregation ATPase
MANGMMPGNPHLRSTPTAMGARLELAPWEVPAERVVELSKDLDTLNALNRTLMVRVRELEAQGASRDQAIAEAVRDVERADDEASKARSSLQLTREEAAILRAKLQALEKEDIQTLELVIRALEKLIPSTRSLP